VYDDVDGHFGDMALITVRFSIYLGSVSTTPVWTGTDSVASTTTLGIGIAERVAPLLAENTYIVIVQVEGDYYFGPTSDPDFITIVVPTGSFVTGGGWIWDGGEKGSFGFVVRYDKTMKPDGNFQYSYRIGEWNYVVKSTSITGLALIGTKASFEGWCTVEKYNSVTEEVIKEPGVFRFRVNCWDRDGTGIADGFEIKITDSLGVLYHIAGGEGVEGYIQGGNIQIHRRK
jgi:hypothetical protein